MKNIDTALLSQHLTHNTDTAEHTTAASSITEEEEKEVKKEEKEETRQGKELKILVSVLFDFLPLDGVKVSLNSEDKAALEVLLCVL